MNTIIYDSRFNANDWFGIIGLCLGIFIIYILPSRFPRKLSILFCLCGVTFGTLADHYIGTVPKSLYDTGNTSDFDFADVPALLMYGPYSYLFFYLYNLFKIKINTIPLYILSWALVSTFIEWLGDLMGVFHYKNGYWLGISFMIYLLIHSFWVIFFHFLVSVQAKEKC
ncbi:hypothetical protein ABE288_05585 [Bacillus salipaludis]|uniref:hypothetical protein n=1 Tax=Bacillus salipaludis TaxID=2547811 RepID=UPI003D208445